MTRELGGGGLKASPSKIKKRRKVSNKIRFLGLSQILWMGMAFSQIWSPPMQVMDRGGGPGVATDSSGTIWCFNANQVTYYNNETGEWAEPMDVDLHGWGSREMTIDKSGRIWILDDNDCYIYYRYYDGSVWSPESTVPTHAPGCFGACIAADSAGGVWVAWSTSLWGPFQVVSNRYDGESWGSPTLVTDPLSGTDNGIGSLVTDRAGKVWVGWTGLTDVGYVSYSEGDSWSDPIEIFRIQAFVGGLSLAADTSGGLWATWHAQYAGSDSYDILVSHYDGNGWSTPETIASTPENEFSFPWPSITVDHSNRAWVTYQHTVSDVPWKLCDIWFAYWNGAEWSEPAPVDVCPDSTDVKPAMGVDGAGRIWVVWARATQSDAITLASYTYGTGIEEKPDIRSRALDAMLFQNQPNPFSQMTDIKFEVPMSGHISLSIYSSTGRLIRTLLDEPKSPGLYTVRWDGRDDRGRLVPAGVYFCRLQAGKFSSSRKLLILR